MNILDFAWDYLFLNSVLAACGVIALELSIWAYKESEYNIQDRKGDIVFGLFLAPLLAFFAMPYVWDFLDGSTIPATTITFSLEWYNPATNIALGAGIDIIFSGYRKYLKKKKEEV